MISSLVLSVLALIPFSVAQSSDPGLQIAAIEAHFSNAGLVPNLLSSFSPEAYLTVNFNGVGDVAPGTALTQDQVKGAPNLSLTPGNSSTQFNGKFTLAMVDAGPVGTDESQGQTRHMLINSVTVSGANVNTTGGTFVTAYAGPAPPAGSGPHRYVILLYVQPDNFSPPANLTNQGVAVGVYNFLDYVKTSNLGPLVAANYFTVEAGTASVSLSPTSAVVSSTLDASSITTAQSSTPTSKSSDATTAVCSLSTVILPILMAIAL